MFSNAEFKINVFDVRGSRIPVDIILRRPIERSGGYAVRYNGRYFKVHGGAGTTPYIITSEIGGRT
jgi:hypothetical protein